MAQRTRLAPQEVSGERMRPPRAAPQLATHTARTVLIVDSQYAAEDVAFQQRHQGNRKGAGRMPASLKARAATTSKNKMKKADASTNAFQRIAGRTGVVSGSV